MEDKLGNIDRLSADLKALQPLKPEYQKRLDEKFRLEFNYNSNHIEGNTLTYGETKLLLFFDKTTGNHELREYEEMKAHDLAFEMVRKWALEAERVLTESDLRNLHKILMVRPFWKEAITEDGQATRRLIEVGNYKKHPNSVRLQNGELFHYASPDDTPAMMGDLMDWLRKEEASSLHPVQLAALLHYKFVRIHPFDDGNGRMSRLLMNFVLLKNNLPPVIIKSSDKKNYLTALNRADSGDIAVFIDYISSQLLWSLGIALKAAKGEKIDEEEDLDKKIALLKTDLERVDPQKEVKEQFTKEVLTRMVDSWITQLLQQVIPAIQDFNSLFTGINHHVSITRAAHIEFISESADEILSKLKEQLKNNQGSIDINNTTLRIQTFYGSLKKGGLKTFGCNYSIEVKFSHIKYEVLTDEFGTRSSPRTPKLMFERLLHQPLSGDEMYSLVKTLKETIYTHIDVNTREIGIR